jgi:hypothetical protein
MAFGTVRTVFGTRVSGVRSETHFSSGGAEGKLRHQLNSEQIDVPPGEEYGRQGPIRS